MVARQHANRSVARPRALDRGRLLELIYMACTGPPRGALTVLSPEISDDESRSKSIFVERGVGLGVRRAQCRACSIGRWS